MTKSDINTQLFSGRDIVSSSPSLAAKSAFGQLLKSENFKLVNDHNYYQAKCNLYEKNWKQRQLLVYAQVFKSNRQPTKT
jgi:hypothetical protein